MSQGNAPRVSSQPNKTMNSSKKLSLPLFEWAGDLYPVIATLSNGVKLVAHKNAPAITDGDMFMTLDEHDDDSAQLKKTKREASRKFQEWTWAQLRPLLECPTYEKPEASGNEAKSTIEQIIVHPGIFHADDVFAAVAASIIAPKAAIIRKDPTPDELDNPNIIVLDIGFRYDPSKNCFDHHQPMYSPGDVISRPRHPKHAMAAFGLFWETHGANVVKAADPKCEFPEEVATAIKERLVVHIDAEDNGILPPNYTVSLAISRINREPGKPDDKFEIAFHEAKLTLLREIAYQAFSKASEKKVQELIDSTQDHILRFDGFLPWKEQASEAPHILFASYPSLRGGWVLECCPPPNKPTAQKIPIPMWAIQDEKLREEFNITFAHSNQFLAVCKSEADVLRLAEELIKTQKR